MCPHPRTSGHRHPPTARRARPCWGHSDISGSDCPWRAIRRELNVRQDGTNCVTQIESLLAQSGQAVVQRTAVIKHRDHSPVRDPQGAAEHAGTWGLRGCDAGETGTGGPPPAACQPFSLSTEPMFPPPAVQASACRLGLGATLSYAP